MGVLVSFIIVAILAAFVPAVQSGMIVLFTGAWAIFCAVGTFLVGICVAGFNALVLLFSFLISLAG